MKFSTVAANVAGTVPIIGTVVGACRIAQQCRKNPSYTEKSRKVLKITQGCFEMMPVLGPAIFWTERFGFLASKKFFKLADRLQPIQRKILIETAAVTSNIAGATPIVGSFVGVIRLCLAGNLIGNQDKQEIKGMQGAAEVVPLIGPVVYWTARVVLFTIRQIVTCSRSRRAAELQRELRREQTELERPKNTRIPYDQQIILHSPSETSTYQAQLLQRKSGGKLIMIDQNADYTPLANLTHQSRLYIVAPSREDGRLMADKTPEQIAAIILGNVNPDIKGAQQQGHRLLKISLVGSQTAAAYGNTSFMQDLGKHLVAGELSSIIAGRAPMTEEEANTYPGNISLHLQSPIQHTVYQPTAQERGLPTPENEVPSWRKTHHLVKNFREMNEDDKELRKLPNPYLKIKPAMQFPVHKT